MNINHLPNGITATNFDGDIVLSGRDMSEELYKKIKTTLHPSIASRLIGWRKTGR